MEPYKRSNVWLEEAFLTMLLLLTIVGIIQLVIVTLGIVAGMSEDVVVQFILIFVPFELALLLALVFITIYIIQERSREL